MRNCRISSPSDNLTMASQVSQGICKLVVYSGQIGECDVLKLRNQAANAFLI